jgi:hypothetical protein
MMHSPDHTARVLRLRERILPSGGELALNAVRFN